MNCSGRANLRQSLRSQSGQFWLGAYMVAEIPFSLVVMLLPEMSRTALLDWIFSGVWPLLLTVAVLILSGILVGLTALRLGWGEASGPS